MFSGYRNVPWLARSHAVTIAPSAAALRTLRQVPPASSSRDQLIGFGDPIFSKEQATKVAGAEPFVRQLCWRDFFGQLLASDPALTWRDLRPPPEMQAPLLDPDEALERWRTGTTLLGIVTAVIPYATIPWERRIERRGLLVRREDYAHALPHCWRCSTPACWRATGSSSSASATCSTHRPPMRSS